MAHMVNGCEVKCLEQSREAFLSGDFFFLLFFPLQAIPCKVTQSPDKEKLTLIHMHAFYFLWFLGSYGIFYLFYSKKQKKINHTV